MSPFVDYGFYKLFGTELNKELLISLLNAIFDRSAQQAPGEPHQVVKDLKEKLENARKMKKLGLDSDLIQQVTNLSAEEIENL